MDLLWYTRNWSTQPQVYINCNDRVPPHERHQCLPRKREGVWRFLEPSWWGKSPRTPSKWSKVDEKLKLIACVHFFSKWNCVDKNVSFLLIWTCTSSYCHTKLLSFSIGLLETHMNNYTSTWSLTPKVIVWCWRYEHRWLKKDWMVNQLQSYFMGKLQPRTFSGFQGCHLLAIVD